MSIVSYLFIFLKLIVNPLNCLKSTLIDHFFFKDMYEKKTIQNCCGDFFKIESSPYQLSSLHIRECILPVIGDFFRNGCRKTVISTVFFPQLFIYFVCLISLCVDHCEANIFPLFPLIMTDKIKKQLQEISWELKMKRSIL